MGGAERVLGGVWKGPATSPVFTDKAREHAAAGTPKSTGRGRRAARGRCPGCAAESIAAARSAREAPQLGTATAPPAATGRCKQSPALWSHRLPAWNCPRMLNPTHELSLGSPYPVAYGPAAG